MSLLRWFLMPCVLTCVIEPVLAVEPPASAPELIPVAELKAAAENALPLLQKGAEGHMTERKCFACHNQTQPVLAMKTAQSRGLTIDDAHLKKHVEFIRRSLTSGRKAFEEGKGQGGNVTNAGNALWTLQLLGAEPDEITGIVTEFILNYQKDDDHWRVTSHRPPSEASHFATNFVIARGLKTYRTDTQKERVEKRLGDVRDWLQKAEAKDTEDRVFKLLALAELQSAPESVKATAADLLKTQRGDGGWSQLESMDSDAYATGTALTALFQTDSLKPDDEAAERGLRFLLKTQLPDGSWHVKSRSKPFQEYFESGFPHDEDQFISSAASGWAATALLLACPKQHLQ